MEWSIDNYLTVVSLGLVFIGGIFTIYQWRKTLDLKRADYIKELTEKIRVDEDIKNILYKIEYGEVWYDEDFHKSKKNDDIESKVDKTLSYFSYICYLKSKKLITKAEFKFFEYRISRILSDKNVIDYFYNLYHYSEGIEANFSFYYLFEYGKKKKLINGDFFDKDFHENENSTYTKKLAW